MPEVEILARHLDPQLRGRVLEAVRIHRPKAVRDVPAARLEQGLPGARVLSVTRRAKYLLVGYRLPGSGGEGRFLAHLGMTGRMYVRAKEREMPRHGVASWELDGGQEWVFEDVRGFGRLSWGLDPLEALGPEPLGDGFAVEGFAAALSETRRPVKQVLLDQSVVAGLGNIYVSESLHEAGIHPGRRGCSLAMPEVRALRTAIRRVLRRAIAFGAGLDLDFAGRAGGEGLFYFGAADGRMRPVERFRVYGREGEACRRCGGSIRRIVQSARSTYFCGGCQR